MVQELVKKMKVKRVVTVFLVRSVRNLHSDMISARTKDVYHGD